MFTEGFPIRFHEGFNAHFHARLLIGFHLEFHLKSRRISKNWSQGFTQRFTKGFMQHSNRILPQYRYSFSTLLQISVFKKPGVRTQILIPNTDFKKSRQFTNLRAAQDGMTVVVGGWSSYGAPHPSRVKGDQGRQIVRPIEISAQIISQKLRRDLRQNCVGYLHILKIFTLKHSGQCFTFKAFLRTRVPQTQWVVS